MDDNPRKTLDKKSKNKANCTFLSKRLTFDVGGIDWNWAWLCLKGMTIVMDSTAIEGDQ